MAEQSLRSPAQMLLAGATPSVYWTEEGISLTPATFVPDVSLTRFGDDGSPESISTDTTLPELIGFYILITPDAEIAKSNRREKLGVQNSAPVTPEEGSYLIDHPTVNGFVPPTDDSYPAYGAPEVEVVEDTQAGFPGGRYGWAFGYSQPSGYGPGKANKKERKATLPSPLKFFDMGNGLCPVLPLPETYPAGATHLDIYLTEPGKKVAFLQRSVPIDKLLGETEYILRGPLRKLAKAPTKNTTGIGQVPQRKKGRDFRLTRSPGRKIREGNYEVGIQLRDGVGAGLLSRLSAPLTVLGDKKLVQTGTEEVPVSEAALTQDALVDAVTEHQRARAYLGDAHYEAFMEAGRKLGAGERISSSSVVPPNPPQHSDATADEFHHDAEGKRPDSPYVLAGGCYAGEEVDSEEDRLITLINKARTERGLANLILNKDLTRMAYREVGGPQDTDEPDYPGDTHTESFWTEADEADLAFSGLDNLAYAPDSPYLAVGVAREPSEDGFAWCIYYGDTRIEDEEPPVMTCETVDPDGTTHVHGHDEDGNHVYLRSVAPDGTEYEDVYSEDVRSGWDCVNDNDKFMGLYYSGSYGTSYANGVGAWRGKSSIDVEAHADRGGQDVTVTDGSLPSGVYGRTYSDGRMVGNSYYLSRNGGNENQAMWCHETGHALGLAHKDSASSIMFYRIDNGRNPNPTSGDVSDLQAIWGAPNSGGTDPGGGDPGEGGEETVTRPVYELVNTGYKEGYALQIDAPDIVKKTKGLTWAPWVNISPVASSEEGTDTGVTGGASYRAYPKNKPGRTAEYFTAFTRSVKVHGYPPEQEATLAPGLAVGLVQEEIPTEDTSRVPDPDQSTLPDEPDMAGKLRPSPGKYLAAVMPEYRTGPRGTVLGPVGPHTSVFLPAGDTVKLMKVNLPVGVNMLRNAEFTRIDGEGMPEDWKRSGIDDVASATLATKDGKLSLSSTVNTSYALNPLVASAPVPVDSDTELFLGGTVGLRTSQVGNAVVQLRQLDEEQNPISGADTPADSDIQAVRLQAVGERPFVLKARGKDVERSDATVLSDATAYVQVLCRLTDAGTADFSEMRLFPFFEDIRRTEEGDPGEPGTPDSPAPIDTPIRGTSSIAVMPPATPKGLIPKNPEEPLSFLDFENDTASNAEFAKWTVVNSGNGATSTLTSMDPVFGDRSYRIASTDTKRTQIAYIERTFSPSREDPELLGFRILKRLVSYSFWGTNTLAVVLGNDATGAIAQVRAKGSQMQLVIRKNAKGSAANTKIEEEVYNLGIPLSEGVLLDLELIVRAGERGSVSVQAGVDGESRRFLRTDFVDLRGRLPQTARVGITQQSDSRATVDMRLDQIAVTRTGDIYDREQPKTPPDFIPLPPDRPILTRGTTATSSSPGTQTYRETFTDPETEDDGLVNQLYFHVRPGDDVDAQGREKPVTWTVTKRPRHAKPGLTYSVAWFSRWHLFDPAKTARVRVKLMGEEEYDLAPIYADVNSTTLTEITGERGWHRNTTGAPEDEVLTFTMPEPVYEANGEVDPARTYTRFEVELETHAGVFVMQEYIPYEGIKNLAERNAIRANPDTVQTSGEFSYIFDAMPPHYYEGLPGAGVFYSDFSLRMEDFTGVTPYYQTSHDKLRFSSPTTDPEYIRESSVSKYAENGSKRFARARVVIEGDGTRAGTPVVPWGALALRTWTMVGCITREDGTHFPGVVYVGNLATRSTTPNVEFVDVSGHNQKVRLSEDIDRMFDIPVLVFTEGAKRELEYLSATGLLRAEIPTTEPELAGGAHGMEYVLSCRGLLNLEARDVPPRVGFSDMFGLESGRRERGAIYEGTIEEAEVIEYAPLEKPYAVSLDFRMGER